MIENWKNIDGYEGIYKISSNGRVKSLARKCLNRGGLRPIPEKILKSSTSNNGYSIIQLNLNGTGTRKYIHRLVADAFIQRIPGKDLVNHIDGIKVNNSSKNLEWCTHQENMDHAKENSLIKKRTNQLETNRK